jgi:hypothetical protein
VDGMGTRRPPREMTHRRPRARNFVFLHPCCERPAVNEPSRSYETRRDAPRHRMPRWAKVLGIVLAVLAILAAVMVLVASGHGGPAKHF